MNINKLREMIRGTHGRFFRVEFTKRTTGEKRAMLARIGVTKHLRGGSRAYDPKDHDLVTAYDLVKKDYRCINLRGLRSFRCGNRKWSAS
jgi:hypothetical protein